MGITRITSVITCEHVGLASVEWLGITEEGKAPTFRFRGFPKHGTIRLSYQTVELVCDHCLLNQVVLKFMRPES